MGPNDPEHCDECCVYRQKKRIRRGLYPRLSGEDTSLAGRAATQISASFFGGRDLNGCPDYIKDSFLKLTRAVDT